MPREVAGKTPSVVGEGLRVSIHLKDKVPVKTDFSFFFSFLSSFLLLLFPLPLSDFPPSLAPVLFSLSYGVDLTICGKTEEGVTGSA